MEARLCYRKTCVPTSDLSFFFRAGAPPPPAPLLLLGRPGPRFAAGGIYLSIIRALC